MSTKKEILTKFTIVYWFVFLLAIAIIAKIVVLQFAEGDKWKQMAMNISQKDIIIHPNRGDICASDGKVLASSVPFYEIRMDFKADKLTDEIFEENIDTLSMCLASFFKDKKKEAYKKELSRAKKLGDRYYLLKKKVSYTDLKTLKEFPLFNLGQNRGGFIAIPAYRRVKPFTMLASRTIGYLLEGETGDKIGYAGIEGAYDSELKGIKGLKLMQKVAGNFWMPVSDANEIEPKDGRDIITTIDVIMQDVAETALYKQLKECNADWGTTIVMEVKTGEIKAIANLKRDSSGEYGEYLNYAISEGVEPGSIFKLPSLVAAMEDGYIDIDDTIDCEGGTKMFYGKPMKDSHQGYRRLSVKQIFEYSSNVGVSKIVYNNYEKNPWKFIERLYSMRLNSPIGLDVRGEAKPLIRNPKDKFWSGLSLPWMSVGYSVQITPLQILNFYNAIANNGKMVKPRFVKAIREHGQIIKTFDVEVLNPSICSQKTIKMAKEMLEGVVERGTATNLKNDHIKIAGKTGTAQIAKNNAGYGQTKSYRGSFIGYFPAENPQYSCIVMINNPRGGAYYGGLISGPVFREIAELVYAKSVDIHKECKPKENLTAAELPQIKTGLRSMLKTAGKGLKVKIDDSNAHAEYVASSVSNYKLKCSSHYTGSNQKIVPDVVGMGISDALFLLENKGLCVTAIGKGTVKFQSLIPGTKVNKNDTIRIELI